MADAAHMIAALKPSADDPDAIVSMHKIVLALASAPAMRGLGTDEAALLGPTMPADKAKEALVSLENKLVEIRAFGEDTLQGLPECQWRNALLLYWHLYKGSQPDFAVTLPGEVDHWRGGAQEFAVTLSLQAQTLIPQQRWVQVTLAISRFSALLINGLCSHNDEVELSKMRKILSGGGLPYPNLRLCATAGGQESLSEEIPVGQHVSVHVEICRDHVAEIASDATPAYRDPHSKIYEAYWVYIEALKPEGTPNNLIQGKSFTVQGDVRKPTVTHDIVFRSPPVPGTYTLRIHTISASVIGVYLSTDVTFTIVEDSVPDLE